MTSVAIFAPSPALTVTIEDHPVDADVHVHPGGQGVWQARMLRRLGVSVTLCSVLLGEVGQFVRHFADDEGVQLLGLERDGRGAAYVHDRREGERRAIVESPGDALTRHDLDELYGLAMHAGLECDATILSGLMDENTLPADVYRRLAADLRAAGRLVIADLAGERLDAALSGGLTLAKVSDSELEQDDRVPADGGREEIVSAMRRMRKEGADHVVVTRAGESILVLSPDGLREVTTPEMQVVDTHGAGDSLTAGVASVLAAGGDINEAITVGAAAGALNVMRHGLGSSQPEAVESMKKHVSIELDANVT